MNDGDELVLVPTSSFEALKMKPRMRFEERFTSKRVP